MYSFELRKINIYIFIHQSW